MGFFRKTGRALKWGFKPAVDVPSWLGSRQISGLSAGVVDSLKGSFRPAERQQGESFNQAMERLALAEADILAQQQAFLRLTITFLSIGVAILLYAIYLFWVGALSSGFLGVALSVLAFANAFRHHFWYFQVKNRKLGCTIKEWWNSKVEETASET